MQENDDIEELILSGALEPAGIDPETGEMLYNFTDKLKDVNPLLHREVNNTFSSHIMRLWELDMITMDITSKNPMVNLTPKAFDPKLMESLEEEVAYTLKEIKRSLIRK
jgi:hypothetical protein